LKVIRLKVEGGFVFALLRLLPSHLPPSHLPPFTFASCCAARKKRLKPWTPWRLPPFTFAPCCTLTPVAVQASGDVPLPPFTFAPFCAARKKCLKPWTPRRLPPSPLHLAACSRLWRCRHPAMCTCRLSPLHLAAFAPAILPQSCRRHREMRNCTFTFVTFLSARLLRMRCVYSSSHRD